VRRLERRNSSLLGSRVSLLETALLTYITWKCIIPFP
jgi:hypothetical protein